MNKYYFTFGMTNELSRCTQPVLAPSMEAAEQIMFDTYGKNWAFGYDEKPEKQKELAPLFYSESPNSMTVKDMQQLYERMNGITRSLDPHIKRSLLKSLLFDIDYAFDIDNDGRAKHVYMRVGEELSESMKGA